MLKAQLANTAQLPQKIAHIQSCLGMAESALAYYRETHEMEQDPSKQPHDFSH